LTITVFDVGHGDSILIEFPDREHVAIVDCHRHVESNRLADNTGQDVQEPKALTYLRDRKERQGRFIVAFLCLSHFHHDHYEGMDRLVHWLREERIQVVEFWDPGLCMKKAKALHRLSWVTEVKEELEDLTALYGILTELLQRGMRSDKLTRPQAHFRSIAGVDVHVLAPDSDHWDRHWSCLLNRAEHARNGDSDGHLACSALLLEYGEARVLLGGDLTCAAWERVFNNHQAMRLRSEGVKVSHHGSREGCFLPCSAGCGPPIWDGLLSDKGTTAAISGGYRTDLPHSDTLNELRKSGITTYCTGDYTSKEPLALPKLLPGIPVDALAQLEEDSSEASDGSVSYHGDIRIAIYPDGKADVSPEFARPVV
jgi:beta-lactamase superfamily II metal-dependent hydrolase